MLILEHNIIFLIEIGSPCATFLDKLRVRAETDFLGQLSNWIWSKSQEQHFPYRKKC